MITIMMILLSQDKKSRKEQKKSGRNKKLSRLFASDCEDELQSVVSDNPNLYNRSISMVNLLVFVCFCPCVCICLFGFPTTPTCTTDPLAW